MYSCKDSDTSQILGIMLVARGADCNIKNNEDKTIWDLAGVVSKEFLQSLQSERETFELQEKDSSGARDQTSVEKSSDQSSTDEKKEENIIQNDENKNNNSENKNNNNNNNNNVIEDNNHDDEVEEIIFERTRSLQSLVADDIPLQSVYSVINVGEMTMAAFSLTQASSFEQCDPQKIANLNNSLKVRFFFLYF